MNRRFVGVIIALIAVAAVAVPASAGASRGKVLHVCKHGCKYRTIQKAVDSIDSGAAKTTILVKPGIYYDGAIVQGHKYDGLAIRGTGKTPAGVRIDGRCKPPDFTNNACGSGGQNGIEGINVDRLKLVNMTARRFPVNGFYVHTESGTNCIGFTMKRLHAAFNRSYGLFAKHCIGGSMTRSEAWGQGDSAFYIGETPPQKPAKARWTNLAHLRGFENVLGYSGTNSKYVRIHDSMFFNNGIGVVPNTLDSERFEPAKRGIIEDNDIFWNNFNYYLPDSPVHTVSGGLGEFMGLQINFPIGAGVVLLGSDGWKVRDNRVFGNFLWGIASLSDPFNEGDDAVNRNNRFTNNKMGRRGTDTNQYDFWDDGSGSGNCWSGNVAGDPPDESNVTFRDVGSVTPALYPDCPPGGAGTGTSDADGEQFGELVGVVTKDCEQQSLWDIHGHPSFRDLEPLMVEGACPP